jgi:hypothetical protein
MLNSDKGENRLLEHTAKADRLHTRRVRHCENVPKCVVLQLTEGHDSVGVGAVFMLIYDMVNLAE